MPPPSTEITPAKPSGVTALPAATRPDHPPRASTAPLSVTYWIVTVLATVLVGVGVNLAGGRWPIAVLTAALVLTWRLTVARYDKRFHAPMLITLILIFGDASTGFLLSHHSQFLSRLTGGLITAYSPTFLTILTTVLAEMIIGRFYWGKMPHLASAYVSGISAGILIKSPLLWPFILCGLLSITSKYVLRIGDRHLWNPTNLGVTLMLFLAPVASLSVEAGNNLLTVAVIWLMGGLILWQVGLLHLPVTFVLMYLPLTYLRSLYSGNAWVTEMAPITSPMFQLFIFFMITDPKTITKRRRSQILVVVVVAVAETFFRVAFDDQHSLFHALFFVGPVANLVEIAYQARLKRSQAAAPPLVPAKA